MYRGVAGRYQQSHQKSARFFKEEEINHIRVFYACTFLLGQVFCGGTLAGSITAQQAEKAVSGWLRSDATSIQGAGGQPAMKVRAFTDEAGRPAYYIVYLRPCGFVVVSADDEVEPIVGYAQRGQRLVKRKRFCSVRPWCPVRSGGVSGWSGKRYLAKVAC